MDRNTGVLTHHARKIVSLSARRAWIEICGGVSARPLVAWSLSARRAWIEIPCAAILNALVWSLSARRAWIEITMRRDFKCLGLVALRKESVDRNVNHYKA